MSFREAVVQGLAPDGGLYQPVDLPRVEPRDLARWCGLPLPALAVELSRLLLKGELPGEAIERLVAEAFSFPAPVVAVEPGLSVLELFHGPTLAFKDFGARFLARLFSYYLAESGEHATVLVATSGDTGSAVARGFHGVPRVQVVVLYPRGRVSAFQEAQMATVGGNVAALAVPGAFDDCQNLVKAAFLDPSLRPLRLSSANSINIGRLLPQSVFYVAAHLASAAHLDRPVVFSVPSGNLGNLTAGVIAQRMGVPVTRFIAATNVNDVLPEFLATGTYRPRAATPTLSNAMDVGDPSNFPRLMALHGGSRDRLAANITGVIVDEAQTRRTIRDVYRRTGYLLDPHGAVGYAAAMRHRETSGTVAHVISLATAHPGKFGAVIREELGFTPALPDGHADWASRPLLNDTLGGLDYAAFRDWLLAHAAREA